MHTCQHDPQFSYSPIIQNQGEKPQYYIALLLLREYNSAQYVLYTILLSVPV